MAKPRKPKDPSVQDAVEATRKKAEAAKSPRLTTPSTKDLAAMVRKQRKNKGVVKSGAPSSTKAPTKAAPSRKRGSGRFVEKVSDKEGNPSVWEELPGERGGAENPYDYDETSTEGLASARADLLLESGGVEDIPNKNTARIQRAIRDAKAKGDKALETELRNELEDVNAFNMMSNEERAAVLEADVASSMRNAGTGRSAAERDAAQAIVQRRLNDSALGAIMPRFTTSPQGDVQTIPPSRPLDITDVKAYQKYLGMENVPKLGKGGMVGFTEGPDGRLRAVRGSKPEIFEVPSPHNALVKPLQSELADIAEAEKAEALLRLDDYIEATRAKDYDAAPKQPGTTPMVGRAPQGGGDAPLGIPEIGVPIQGSEDIFREVLGMSDEDLEKNNLVGVREALRTGRNKRSGNMQYSKVRERVQSIRADKDIETKLRGIADRKNEINARLALLSKWDDLTPEQRKDLLPEGFDVPLSGGLSASAVFGDSANTVLDDFLKRRFKGSARKVIAPSSSMNLEEVDDFSEDDIFAGSQPSIFVRTGRQKNRPVDAPIDISLRAINRKDAAGNFVIPGQTATDRLNSFLSSLPEPQRASFVSSITGATQKLMGDQVTKENETPEQRAESNRRAAPAARTLKIARSKRAQLVRRGIKSGQLPIEAAPYANVDNSMTGDEALAVIGGSDEAQKFLRGDIMQRRELQEAPPGARYGVLGYQRGRSGEAGGPIRGRRVKIARGVNGEGIPNPRTGQKLTVPVDTPEGVGSPTISKDKDTGQVYANYGNTLNDAQMGYFMLQSKSFGGRIAAPEGGGEKQTFLIPDKGGAPISPSAAAPGGAYTEVEMPAESEAILYGRQQSAQGFPFELLNQMPGAAGSALTTTVDPDTGARTVQGTIPRSIKRGLPIVSTEATSARGLAGRESRQRQTELRTRRLARQSAVADAARIDQPRTAQLVANAAADEARKNRITNIMFQPPSPAAYSRMRISPYPGIGTSTIDATDRTGGVIPALIPRQKLVKDSETGEMRGTGTGEVRYRGGKAYSYKDLEPLSATASEQYAHIYPIVAQRQALGRTATAVQIGLDVPTITKRQNMTGVSGRLGGTPQEEVAWYRTHKNTLNPGKTDLEIADDEKSRPSRIVTWKEPNRYPLRGRGSTRGDIQMPTGYALAAYQQMAKDMERDKTYELPAVDYINKTFSDAEMAYNARNNMPSGFSAPAPIDRGVGGRFDRGKHFGMGQYAARS